MKINILGAEYDYKEPLAKDDEGMIENSYLQGESRYYKKEIVVKKTIEPENYKKHIQRHEIIHAFFHESGLEEKSQDEDLINWISMQFPKMLEVFNKIGAL